MLSTVSDVLTRHGVGSNRHLCVALSGGVDSVVMLDVLHRLQARFGFKLSAAHVNHGISENANAWAVFCACLCEQLGVPSVRFEVSVPEHDASGLEAAARRLRHDALNSLGADWLVFAHHADDQAETLLFRLARGAGVRGMAGMRMCTPPGNACPGRLRPLLHVRRSDIQAYAIARGLQWVEDESNADPRFSRNFLRAKVFPPLEQGFVAAVDNMVRAADNFAEADDLLESLANLDRDRCGTSQDGRLLLAALLQMPDARVFNLLRSEVRRHGLVPPSRSRLQECVRQMRTVIDLPLHYPMDEIACCVYRGRVWFETIPAAMPETLSWSGQSELPWSWGHVCFERRSGEGVSLARLQSADRVRLVVRWEGLSLRAAPGRPRRSFKKWCQDADLPPWWRDHLPILQVDGEAAWVGGLGVAGDFMCAPNEEGVLPLWVR